MLQVTNIAYAGITQQKVIASDGADYDDFGSSIDISGHFAIVGAPNDYIDTIGEYTGSAYIYALNKEGLWTERTKLIASDAERGRRFGFAVSVSGKTAMIGAPNSYVSSFPGSVYAFRFKEGSWVEEVNLLPSDQSDYQAYGFGVSVDLEGDVAVIGAPQHGFHYEGAVYVFRFNGEKWIEQAILTASDGTWEDAFGSSVAIDKGRIVVGARDDDAKGAGAGSAYVFEYDGNNWVEKAKLTTSDARTHQFFGTSVTIDGKTIAVGAPGYWAVPVVGSCYVFEYDGQNWIEKNKLVANGADAEKQNFGISVSLSKLALLVGADGGQDNSGNLRGIAYLFTNEEGKWIEQEKIIGGNSDVGDYTFGCAVATQEGRAIVGAKGDTNENGWSAGATYLLKGIPNETTDKIFADDGSQGNAFGYSVDLSGKNVAASALYENAVYLFESEGMDWQQTTKLVPEEKKGALFGYSVATSQNLVIVASPFEEEDSRGAAYIFTKNGSQWYQQARLSPEGAVYAAWGSQPVDIIAGKNAPSKRPMVLIGDPGSNSVFLFTYDGTQWNQETKLVPEESSAEGFGFSVSTNGKIIAVGAQDNVKGAVYIFEYTGHQWIQTARLVPSDETFNGFGLTVSLSGERVLVGRVLDPHGGAAYIFKKTKGGAWAQEVVLRGSDESTNPWFGYSVSLSGRNAVISAFDDLTPRSGPVYLFTLQGNTWIETTKLIPSDFDPWKQSYGQSVVIDSQTVTIGAPGDDDRNFNAGAVYLFTQNKYKTVVKNKPTGGIPLFSSR